MNNFYRLFSILIITINCNSIDYNHENYVFSEVKSFPLPEKTINIAQNANYYLNFSKFFDTKLIADSQRVQKELSKDPSHREIVIKTLDNQKLICSFFDRQKDKIIIIGPGFTNSKEKMIPFAHMFDDFDILIINFRGHIYNAFGGIDVSTIKLGMVEENDVFATIECVRRLKEYKKVIGLGICFGAFIFAKTQGIAEEKNLRAFDKIILDGCWLSLREFSEKLKNDPYLIVDPQRGGASYEVKWLFKKNLISNSIIKIVQALIDVNIDDISIRNYLKRIKKTPVLFFYGKNDLTINRREFEEIWNCTDTKNKIAIITSKPHVHNHLKIKEIYKLICELFINEDISQTIELLAEPEKLLQLLTKRFNENLQKPCLSFPKPNVLIPGKSLWSYVSPILWPTCVYGLLYTGYKSGKIKNDLAIKIAKIYGVYKLIEYGWRPAIRIISKL